MSSRSGQRYDDDNKRIVTGTIPFRIITESDNNTNNKEETKVVNNKTPSSSKVGNELIELLVVTCRRKKEKRTFPKGGWELDDEDLEHGARRETLEEAGVSSALKLIKVNKNEITPSWEYLSKKKKNGNNDVKEQERGCTAHMFLMRVTEIHDTWLEDKNRIREWVSPARAKNILKEDWMKDALQTALDQNLFSSSHI